MKLLRFLPIILFFMSCNQAEIDRLKKMNDELKTKLENKQLELAKAKTEANKIDFLKKQLQGIKAKIETTYGTINVEFYPDKAPIHVSMFVARAESGFYNNTQFHRVIPNFMIQGGDPNSKDNNFSDDGSGGPVFMIPHEFNDTKHVAGILSTARVGDKSVGAGSQFFIMHGASPHLDKEYTVFGNTIDGLEVINKIVNVSRDQRDHPKKAVRIKRITIYK